MAASNMEQIMTIIGTIGGFSISLSLVPQVYLTYKTKCADDISYTYQVIYIFGASLVNAYALYFQLYAVYLPCLLELIMIITLTIMKMIYPPRKDLINISRHSMISVSRHNNMNQYNCLAELIRELAAVENDSELGNDLEGIIDVGRTSDLVQRKLITILKQTTLDENTLERTNTDDKEDKLGKSDNIDVTEKTGIEDLNDELADV